MMSESARAYEIRLNRFNDAVALRKPDRIPFIPFDLHYFPTSTREISNKEAMNDHRLRFQCLKETVLAYDFGLAPGSGLRYGSPIWNIMGQEYWKKPGVELDDDEPFQFVEQEYMSADEYDNLLSDPSDFTLRTIWPRITRLFEPLRSLPRIPALLFEPEEISAFVARSEFLQILDGLKALGRAYEEYNEIFSAYLDEMGDLGYPPSWAAAGYPAFDVISVFLRGLRGAMLDMYRCPEKLLAAIDLLTDIQLENMIRVAEITDNPRVVIFCYRGSAGFMSDEQFRTFCWPSLRKEILGLIDAGLTPIPYVEGDYTPRLPYLVEIPSGKVAFHFDVIDRKAASKTIGDLHCFWGNIPSSLLMMGSPDDVKADVRELIELFGGNGGLIVDGAADIPDGTEPENLEAIQQAIDEHGSEA